MASVVLMARAMKLPILSFLVFLLVACGGESASQGETKSETTPTMSACEAAGTKLCARACTCATDGKCHIGTLVDGGTAALNFVDEKACLDMYVVLGCFGGGEPGFDYAPCAKALEASACVDTAGGQGVLMPPACNVSRK
jgi:hypothetical protein